MFLDRWYSIRLRQFHTSDASEPQHCDNYILWTPRRLKIATVTRVRRLGDSKLRQLQALDAASAVFMRQLHA